MVSITVRACLRAMLLVLACMSVPTHALDAASSAGVVERFQAGLIDVMRTGPTLGYDGRRERLDTLLHGVFDVPQIAKTLLGDASQTLVAAEREALRSAIFDYAVAALAGAFTNYSGEQFQTGKISRLKSGKVRVRSVLVEGDSDRNKLNYVLLATAGEWRIVDLWFNGVSGVRIYTAEFRSLLGRQSAQALVDELRRRVQALEAKNR
jgi:phospholipid transport system substrate-binding protein